MLAEFRAKHGDIAGRGAAVVAMGSLGADRLNALSDLDLLVIYDAETEANSDGRRSLSTRPYFARLTQALVTALSAPTAEGRLYEVDMRLRPSGRQGPVATSWESFRNYQRSEAWTWEHLALTRARGIAGPADLTADIDAFCAEIIAEKGQGTDVLSNVADMRARLAEAKPGGGWDAKNGPGRLMDTDLAVQTLALRSGRTARNAKGQCATAVDVGLLGADQAKALVEAQGLFWRLQSAARLLTGDTLDPQALGEGGRRFVLREVGCDSLEALEERIDSVSNAADAAVTALLEDPR